MKTMRDSHDRIIGYEREPEWDDTERNWMLALDDYEQSLCPLCGLPREICHDPKSELTLHAEAEACWATAHMQQASEQWRKDHPTSKAAHALTTKLTA